MNIEIRFSASDHETLITEMREYVSSWDSIQTTLPLLEDGKAEKPKKVRAKKSETPLEAAIETAINGPEEPEKVSIDNLRKTMNELIGSGSDGMSVAQGILKRAGADRLSSLNPDKYSEVIEACKKEIASCNKN